MTSNGPKRLQRLALISGLLRWRGGHSYAETLGWRRLAEERGFRLDVFANARAAPDLLAELDAVPLLDITPADVGRFLTEDQFRSGHAPELAPLTHFLLNAHMIGRVCKAAWERSPARPDVVLFAWTNPAQMSGAADWLADLPPAERPKVAFNIGLIEGWRADEGRRRIAGDFRFFRFAARRLRAVCAPQDLTFTATDPRLASAVANLTEGPCHPAPLHIAYPAAAEIEAWRAESGPRSGPRVSILGALREDKGAEIAADALARVAQADGAATFFLQAPDPVAAAKVRARLGDAAARATIATEPLVVADYYRALVGSDVLLLPYRAQDYAFRPSGVFAEAVVCGTPTVVPADSWMSDRRAEGWSAGEIFGRAEPEGVAQAVLATLARLPEHRDRAAGQAEAWRARHSLEAFFDHLMRELGLAAP